MSQVYHHNRPTPEKCGYAARVQDSYWWESLGFFSWAKAQILACDVVPWGTSDLDDLTLPHLLICRDTRAQKGYGLSKVIDPMVMEPDPHTFPDCISPVNGRHQGCCAMMTVCSEAHGTK